MNGDHKKPPTQAFSKDKYFRSSHTEQVFIDHVIIFFMPFLLDCESLTHPHVTRTSFTKIKGR